MKKKVISAIVAIILIVPLVILGGYYFAGGVTLIGCLGLRDLLLHRESGKYPLLVKLICYLFFLIIVMSGYFTSILELTIDIKVLVCLVIALLLPVLIYDDNKKYNTSDALYLIGCTLFLGIAFQLFILFRNYNIHYLVMIILISTVTDTFAQLFGSLIGKRKIAPNISPGKTIAGSVMGSLCGTFVVTVYYLTLVNTNAHVMMTTAIILLLTVVGQLGDLIFSAIKRQHNIKDFSNIMPGHGGILDRLDSMIFILLVFALLIGYI